MALTVIPLIWTGTLVDATIIASASEADGEAHWVKHKGKPARHGFKAHVGADAETALVEEIAVTPANVNDGMAGRTDPDIATLNVRNRVSLATAGLPSEVKATGVSVKKQSSALLRVFAISRGMSHAASLRGRGLPACARMKQFLRYKPRIGMPAA